MGELGRPEDEEVAALYKWCVWYLVGRRQLICDRVHKVAGTTGHLLPSVTPLNS